MPDISMCANGVNCERKSKCYRFTAFPSGLQSYATFYEEGKYCEYFILDWSNLP